MFCVSMNSNHWINYESISEKLHYFHLALDFYCKKPYIEATQLNTFKKSLYDNLFY